MFTTEDTEGTEARTEEFFELHRRELRIQNEVMDWDSSDDGVFSLEYR